MSRQPFNIHPRTWIPSEYVRHVIVSAERKPIARLERWAARMLRRYLDAVTTEAEMKYYFGID